MAAKGLQALMLVGGLVLLGVGGGILFAPGVFYEAYDIDLFAQTGLYSEVRANGATLLIAGTLMLASLFRREIPSGVILVGAVIYLPHGLGRLFSMLVDGLPASGLIIAAVAELLLGLLLLRALCWRLKRGTGAH